MHRGFFDKRRRFLNLRKAQIESVLPEHFVEFYPKFLTLLKKYYDWQEEQPSTELIAHLFATRDINETDITLLSYIEDELLLGEAYFEGFGDTDAEKRAAANFSNILFRSKGSKFAIEWFFRSFYGLDAEVFYPKENIFLLNDNESRLGPDSLRYITNDKLYQTFAILIRVGVPISKWRDIYKLFAHPAGMYLGAEISINDAVTAAIDPYGTTDSDVVIQRPAPVYLLTPYVNGIAKDSAFEGQNVNWVASATNLLDNIGAAYWYVTNVSPTLDSSEFFDSANIPRIANPAYLALNDSSGVAAGRFDIKVLNDEDETEGTEQYKVSLIDTLGKVLTEKIMNIKNAIATYTLTASPSTTVYEGDTVTFTITGTNLPNEGNTSVVWFVAESLSTTNDDDFDEVPPRIGSRRRVNIVDGVGTFTLKPIIDAELDDLETARVVIRKDSASTTALDFVTLTILDVPFTLGVSVPNITEGDDIVATITVDAASVGQVVTWQITGPDLSRLESTSGSVVMTSTSVNVTIGTTADDTYYSPNVYTFSATSPGGGTTISDNFTIADLAPVYEIVASPAIGTPGGTTTFSVEGSNIPDGPVYFFVTYGTATAPDFTATPPLTASRETINLVSNTGSAAPISFTADADGTEEFTVFIYDQPTGGTLLAELAYTISAGGYSLTSANSVNEGASITFTFTAPVAGTYYYWITGTGITSSDFTSGYATSTSKIAFSAPAGTGTFTLTIANDATLEGAESFTASVSAGSASTSGALATKTVTINDTSTGGYTTNAPDVVEGATFTPTVTRTSGSGTETVYLVMTGAATAKFATLNTTATFTSNTTLNVSGFGNPTYSAIYQGPLSGTIEVRRGSVAGTLLTSDGFTVTDAAATYTLTPSDATPNEGDTVTFTLGGTNIPNGAAATTYYYRASGVTAVQTSGSSASGQTRLNLASTAGLAVGMSSDNGSVPGTILSVSTTYVTMSTTLTGTVSSGTVVHFAQPATWADFTSVAGARGSFTVTNNTGSFNSGIATDADISNDVYTFSVYSAAYGTGALASATITIQETTTNPLVDIQIAAGTVFTQETQNNNGYTIAGIRFLSNGEIYTSSLSGTILNNNLQKRLIGTWIDPNSGFNPELYSLKFTAIRTSFSSNGINNFYNPGPGGYYTLDNLKNTAYPAFNTVGPIQVGTTITNRDVYVEGSVGDVTLAASIIVSYNVTVTVFETANPANSDSFTFTMTMASYAKANQSGPTGGNK